MHKIYELDDSGKFIGDFILLNEGDPLPKNWVDTPFQMPCASPRFSGSRSNENGKWEGVWVDDGPAPASPDVLAVLERVWRNQELDKADIEINRLEDRGLDSQLWRDYRVALRGWPENSNFPIAEHRPEAPE